MVIRTVELIAMLTGRGPRPFPVFSVLAPVVLTDDLLTEMLLLQKQMIPDNDLKRAASVLRVLDPEIVRRINPAAGVIVDWAAAVTTTAIPSSSMTFKHGIFARSSSEKGIDCIPVTLKKAKSRQLSPIKERRRHSKSATGLRQTIT